MAPHIFHALADDPSRQFGCMATLFHLLHHHRPFTSPRRRTISPSSMPTAGTADELHSPPHHRKLHASRDSSVSDKAETLSNASLQRNCERAPNCVKRHGQSPSSATAPATVLRCTISSSSDKLDESPSILNSSRSTNYMMRESPHKCLYHVAEAEDDDERIKFVNQFDSSNNMDSRSSPSSPYVPLAQALREARRCPVRSSGVCKSLFLDMPPATTESAVRDVCHQSRLVKDKFLNSDVLSCEGQPPSVVGLQESLKALKLLLDGMDAHSVQQNAKPEEKSSVARRSRWWSSAKSKSKIFKRNTHQLAEPHRHTVNGGLQNVEAHTVEAPLAARTSSFDYHEAVRISQKIEETPARLSLDGRELVPKSVMKLREALRRGHIRLDGSEGPLNKFASKPPPSNRQKNFKEWTLMPAAGANVEEPMIAKRNAKTAPDNDSSVSKGFQRSNVVARLMGLEGVPIPRSKNDNGEIFKKDSQSQATGLPFLFKDLIKRSESTKLDREVNNKSFSPLPNQIESQDPPVFAAPVSSSCFSPSNMADDYYRSSESPPRCNSMQKEESHEWFSNAHEDYGRCGNVGEVKPHEQALSNRTSGTGFLANTSSVKVRLHDGGEVTTKAKNVHTRSMQSNRCRSAREGNPSSDCKNMSSTCKELHKSVVQFAADSRIHDFPCKIVLMKPSKPTRTNFPTLQKPAAARCCEQKINVEVGVSSNANKAVVCNGFSASAKKDCSMDSVLAARLMDRACNGGRSTVCAGKQELDTASYKRLIGYPQYSEGSAAHRYKPLGKAPKLHRIVSSSPGLGKSLCRSQPDRQSVRTAATPLTTARSGDRPDASGAVQEQKEEEVVGTLDDSTEENLKHGVVDFVMSGTIATSPSRSTVLNVVNQKDAKITTARSEMWDRHRKERNVNGERAGEDRSKKKNDARLRSDAVHWFTDVGRGMSTMGKQQQHCDNAEGGKKAAAMKRSTRREGDERGSSAEVRISACDCEDSSARRQGIGTTLNGEKTGEIAMADREGMRPGRHGGDEGREGAGMGVGRREGEAEAATGVVESREEPWRTQAYLQQKVAELGLDRTDRLLRPASRAFQDETNKSYLNNFEDMEESSNHMDGLSIKNHFACCNTHEHALSNKHKDEAIVDLMTLHKHYPLFFDTLSLLIMVEEEIFKELVLEII